MEKTWFEKFEEEYGLPAEAFLKFVLLLCQGECRVKRVEDEYSLEDWSPRNWLIDLDNKCFIEDNRPEGYEEHLYFKDYGTKWFIIEKEKN